MVVHRPQLTGAPALYCLAGAASTFTAVLALPMGRVFGIVYLLFSPSMHLCSGTRPPWPTPSTPRLSTAPMAGWCAPQVRCIGMLQMPAGWLLAEVRARPPGHAARTPLLPTAACCLPPCLPTSHHAFATALAAARKLDVPGSSAAAAQYAEKEGFFMDIILDASLPPDAT